MATGTVASPTHAARHAVGQPDALAWGTIHGSGTLASRPTASAANLNYYYTQTDAAGSGPGIYQQLGGTWTLLATVGAAAQAATASVAGVIQLAGDLAGSSASPQVAKVNGTTVPTSSAASTYLKTSGAGVASWAPISVVDNGDGTTTITY